MTTTTGHGRRGTALAVAGAALLAAGVVAWARPVTGGTPEAGPARQAQVAGSGDEAAGPTPEPVVAPTSPGAPRRVLIPALDVAARVVPVRTVGDTLVPPSDPGELGWWADGARPGAARGSALVAGHTVHTGGGALQDLESLTAGQRVLVRTSRARLVYEVTSVHVYDKGRIARDAERLFSQGVPGRLVLVTCEDWDGTRFLSNVVAVATPVD
jgi:sortase (surface protein transpeptidase)